MPQMINSRYITELAKTRRVHQKLKLLPQKPRTAEVMAGRQVRCAWDFLCDANTGEGQGKPESNCGGSTPPSRRVLITRHALSFLPSEKFGHFRVCQNYVRVALQRVEVMMGKSYAAFGRSQQNPGFLQ